MICEGCGLFAGQPFKKDEFIGEYLGEIITYEEANNRHIYYDVNNYYYLF